MTVAEQLADAKRALSVAEAEVNRVQAIADATNAKVVSKKLWHGMAAEAYLVHSGNGGSMEVVLHNKSFDQRKNGAPAHLIADCLNETFDRLRYAMDNPDVAVSFTDDGTPRLSARDDSGIDHEALFKIGRAAR